MMKAHRTDGVSLGFGIVFLFLTGWWVLAQFVTLALPAIGWMVAISLIIFGLAGLVGAFRSGRGAVPAPTSGAPVSAVPVSGLPTGMHADIVRELMENQRTSGRDTAIGIDDTRVDVRPNPAAAFAPVQPSPYATDHLTAPDTSPTGEPHPSDGETRPADGDRTEVIEEKTEVIDETPTTEIRAEGDGGRR
ncbi:hypothetical protein [Catenuloplanes indicus]|uniref:Uncharacterized protein n=1 Tax=Catenuloplanes indicus TaxID=137267 RepID=A0AAE3W0G6_9ACTN|nr:hypothetical protein [Catenuloplanes indicus]MDQ0367076.1 hypothetical protein [Catenuloplanes indicus]